MKGVLTDYDTAGSSVSARLAVVVNQIIVVVTTSVLVGVEVVADVTVTAQCTLSILS